MVMKFVKKDLTDYINGLMNKRRNAIDNEFSEMVKEKFSPIIEPISLSLPNGDKIMKIAKQLSKAIQEFEEPDPSIRHSYNVPSSYRYVSQSIDYLTKKDMSLMLKEDVYKVIIDKIRSDRMIEVIERIERYSINPVDKEKISLVYSECFSEYQRFLEEVKSIHQITVEALRIVLVEKTAKKAYNILKGMGYPLDEFDKKMLVKKPSVPAIYKFSEPVCKLTAACEE